MTGSTDSRQRTGERTGARTASALLGVCIGIAVAIGPAGALADQTAIQQNPNELSLDAPGGILDQLYGLANLTRVEDSAFVPNDQIWLQVTSGSATAQARFASLTHRFGYFDGASATFTQLFEVSGPSPGILDPPGPMALFAPAGPTFRFGLQAVSGGSVANTWSSQPSENGDGAKDHLVSWRIAGPGDRYVIAWEDLPIATPGPGASEPDYNDLVIEVSGVAPFGCGNGVLDPGEQCDDGNTASGDCCSATCQAEADGNSCADSNLCNGSEICQAGACVAGTPLLCDDGNVCTTNSCDPAIGCVSVPNSASCDDGNACSIGDICIAGSCSPGAPLACDDGNVCTTNSCDPAIGCVSVPNSASCDDGNACSVGDFCSGGSCVAGGPLTCDDGNSCTDDSCDSATGCQYVENPALCGPITAPVQPILECVEENGPGDFVAHFGFLNENDAPVAIPVGAGNFFDPPPIDRGQPIEFAPGRSPLFPNAAFQVPFDGDPLSWTLGVPGGAPETTTASAASSRCPQPPELLRQFSLCYNTANQIGSPKIPTLSLEPIEDLFGAGSFDLRRTNQLCAPVEITFGDELHTPISPTTHLQSRSIVLTRTQPRQPALDPRDPALQNIRVEDLFGIREMDVRRLGQFLLPAAICNPAVQSCPGDPAQLSLDELAANEFQCYKARPSADSPRFPRNLHIAGVDPFLTRVYQVKAPKLLCARANRNDADPGAISDLEGLMCYGLSVPSFFCEPGAPPPHSLAKCRKSADCGGARCVVLPRPLVNKWVLGVRTHSDAGAQILKALHPKLLCVPARFDP